jgi:WD40 repeat protein
MRPYLLFLFCCSQLAYSMTMEDAKFSPKLIEDIGNKIFRNEQIKFVYLSNGNLFLSHSNSGQIRLWSLDKQKPNEAQLLDTELAPDCSSELLCADIDTVHQKILISANNKQCVYSIMDSKILNTIKSGLRSIHLLNRAKSISGKYIATWDSDDRVRLWDNAGKDLDYQIACPIKDVASLAFDDQETAVVISYHNGSTSTHAIVNAEALRAIRDFSRHKNIILKKQSKSGKYIVTLDSNFWLQLWDGVSGKNLDSGMGYSAKEAKEIGFNDEESTVTITSKEGVLSEYNIVNYEALKKISSSSYGASFIYKEQSKDGSRIITLDSRSSVGIWDGLTGESIKTLNIFGGSKIQSVGFSDDGTTAFVDCKDCIVECKFPLKQ